MKTCDDDVASWPNQGVGGLRNVINKCHKLTAVVY